MKRTRDYAAEYAARLKRAKQKGYSKTIARGHPAKGEIGIKRARAMLLPGPVQVIRPRKATRHGYRPTFAEIRARLDSLNLRFLAESIKGKRGRVPVSFSGGRIIDDDNRDRFIDALTRWGFAPREAYTLWFSP
jgi:hypothetical protein